MVAEVTSASRNAVRRSFRRRRAFARRSWKRAFGSTGSSTTQMAPYRTR